MLWLEQVLTIAGEMADWSVWLLHWSHDNSFILDRLLIFFKYFSQIRIEVDCEGKENAKIRDRQVALVELQESVKFSFIAIEVEKWSSFAQAWQLRTNSAGGNFSYSNSSQTFSLTFRKEIAAKRILPSFHRLDRVRGQSSKLATAIAPSGLPKKRDDTS